MRDACSISGTGANVKGRGRLPAGARGKAGGRAAQSMGSPSRLMAAPSCVRWWLSRFISVPFDMEL